MTSPGVCRLCLARMLAAIIMGQCSVSPVIITVRFPLYSILYVKFLPSDHTDTDSVEHYFQNIESQRVSPNAPILVRQYLKKGGKSNHYSWERPFDLRPAPAIFMVFCGFPGVFRLLLMYEINTEINRNHYLIKRRITTDLVSMAYTASNGDHHNHKSNNEDGKDDKDEVDNDNNPIRVANEATRGATRNSYIQTGISFRESQSTTL